MGADQSVTFRVGERTLKVHPLLALDALELVPVVMLLAAPLARSLGAELGSAAAEAPEAEEARAAALAGAFAASAGGLLEGIAKALLSPEAKGQVRILAKAFAGRSFLMRGDLPESLEDEDRFNAVFAGNLPALGEWLSLCLRLNYADFFATALRKLLAPEPSQSR
jgi:hypothetical protein